MILAEVLLFFISAVRLQWQEKPPFCWQLWQQESTCALCPLFQKLCVFSTMPFGNSYKPNVGGFVIILDRYRLVFSTSMRCLCEHLVWVFWIFASHRVLTQFKSRLLLLTIQSQYYRRSRLQKVMLQSIYATYVAVRAPHIVKNFCVSQYTQVSPTPPLAAKLGFWQLLLLFLFQVASYYWSRSSSCFL